MRRPIIRTALVTVLLAAAGAALHSWQGKPDAGTASAASVTAASLESVQMEGAYRKGSYDEYRSQFPAGASTGQAGLTIEGESYIKAEGMQVSPADDAAGRPGKAIVTGESGTVEWRFEVPAEGLYNLRLNYDTPKGKESDIERELLIDGKLPFSEARSIVLARSWKNDTNDFTRDDRGNELIPGQLEVPGWRETLLKDTTGYYTEPYLFHFTQGTHTLSLRSVKEPLTIDSIQLTSEDLLPSYEEAAAQYKEEGLRSVPDVMLKIQGEHASLKSSPTLLPYNDRSSPLVEPFHVSKLRNNAIGAWSWRMPGQWIEWEVDAPEDGLYQIAFKNRQNYLRGQSALRTLSIDGKVPFAEAKSVAFPYGRDWQMNVIGKSPGSPYLFYLKKGAHRIRLEATLGEMAPVIRVVESSILELNAMYRQIISFTGTVPDTFRDYQLEERIPDMTALFRKQSKLLRDVAAVVEGPDGESSERSAMLNTLAYQLEDMARKPESVPSRIDRFKTNVGGLGDWLFSFKEQPLAIDYLLVSTPDAKLPDPKASAWKKLGAGFQSFFSSFTENYDDFSSEDDSSGSVTVWITSARDQAQVVKRLIDDSFTAKTGIRVSLKLVSSDVVLPATVAGKGPDVALQMGNETPVNYATRNAVQDLSAFPDFGEVRSRFLDSAMVPYAYNGKVYALPEQMTFPMLFYRRDIVVDELKESVPQTWEDVYELIPRLQKHNLEFGLPQKPLNMFGNDIATTDIMTLPPSPSLAMLLYQNDGRFYSEDGQVSGLDSETAIRAFKTWTDLYVNYKLPISVDFANRFRTGEMPIGIADYTMYNKLSVFAPEIKGLWEFAPVPGTPTASGGVRRET